MRSGSQPAASRCVRNDCPLSVRIAVSSSETSSSPSAIRLPRWPPCAPENQLPASSARIAITVTSRAGTIDSACSAAIAARPAITPAAPSKLPPLGTESTCEPISQAGAFGSRPGSVM